MASLYLDISTAPLPEAASFIEAPRPPGNYRDEAKIETWIAEKKAERLAEAGLDLDLCQVTGAAWLVNGEMHVETTGGDVDKEMRIIAAIAQLIKDGHELVTYNGRWFDIPVLKRRARYLGIWFPAVSCDRFKSPIVDLLAYLSDNDPTRKRSLTFFCKRLGWADLCEKPLDGREEANVLQTGAWEALEASLVRDVTAIQRLAEWAGL